MPRVARHFVWSSQENVLADAFEAVIGAVFCDGNGYGGLALAGDIVLRLCGQVIVDIARTPVTDFKSKLQVFYQQLTRCVPDYEDLGHSGPDHCRSFEVAVNLYGETFATGRGKSKKAAEQDAARAALVFLGL